jgi:hypothetical protein
MNEPFINTILHAFDVLTATEQALFLSKIKPKAGVGDTLADVNNTISDKDFLAWVLEVEAEYEANFGVDDYNYDEQLEKYR